MKPLPKAEPRLVERIYHVVYAAIWAVLVVWLGTIVIAFPGSQEARATAERQRAQELADENRTYCEKWGMRAGTRQHTLCTLDLQDLRAKHAARLARELDFIP